MSKPRSSPRLLFMLPTPKPSSQQSFIPVTVTHIATRSDSSKLDPRARSGYNKQLVVTTKRATYYERSWIDNILLLFAPRQAIIVINDNTKVPQTPPNNIFLEPSDVTPSKNSTNSHHNLSILSQSNLDLFLSVYLYIYPSFTFLLFFSFILISTISAI